MRRVGSKGFSVAELVLSLGLVSIISLALFGILSFGTKAWRSVESRQRALAQLNVASTELIKDVSPTNIEQSAIQPVPGLSGKQGDCVWFLSAIDPTTSRFVRSPDTGKPVWQVNVLYYLIQPLSHDEISGGIHCVAVDGGDGYDSGCPHKVLVKKIIDLVPQPDPLDEENQETLMTAEQALDQLNPPQGYSTVNILSDPGVVPRGASTVARGLLSFQVEKPGTPPDIVVLTLRSVRLEEARKEIPLGAVDLLGTKHTLQQRVEIVPKN